MIAMTILRLFAMSILPPLHYPQLGGSMMSNPRRIWFNYPSDFLGLPLIALFARLKSAMGSIHQLPRIRTFAFLPIFSPKDA
jgi:hypothetical protein